MASLPIPYEQQRRIDETHRSLADCDNPIDAYNFMILRTANSKEASKAFERAWKMQKARVVSDLCALADSKAD